MINKKIYEKTVKYLMVLSADTWAIYNRQLTTILFENILLITEFGV